MSLPSASKLDLAFQCGYAFSPHAPKWPKQTYSKAANFGKGQHAVAEKAVKGETVDAVKEADTAEVTGNAEVARFKRVARDVELWFKQARNRPVEWLVEKPLAYHVERGSARYMKPPEYPRDYRDKKFGEIVGTLDLAAVLPDIVEVLDLKTGKGARESSVADSAQLKFYALCLARIHGVPRARITYLHATEDGIDDGDTVLLDELDLGQFAAQLGALAAGLQDAVPVPGPHCTGKWCPMVSICPATTKALAAIDKASDLTRPFSTQLTIEDATHAADVRVRLKMVQAACASIEEQLKTWVKSNGPIDIGNGMQYGVREENRETVDIGRPQAYQILAKRLGPKADQIVTLSTTKQDIRSACDTRAQAEDIFEELRAVGALRSASYSKLTEWKKR